jgi:hypothetical protein
MMQPVYGGIKDTLLPSVAALSPSWLSFWFSDDCSGNQGYVCFMTIKN